MDIKELAEALGWTYLSKQPDKWYQRFEKDGIIFDIWPTTGTIRIIKDHRPSYYRDSSEAEIERLLTDN